MPRPYIDLVGGSGQVKVKEVHWATNAETVVRSQEVPENKVCAVLSISSRCPSLAPEGDRILGETDRFNIGWVHLNHTMHAFTCKVTTQGNAQNKTQQCSCRFNSPHSPQTVSDTVSKHHILKQHPPTYHFRNKTEEKLHCTAALFKIPLRGFPRMTCSVQERIKGVL